MLRFCIDSQTIQAIMEVSGWKDRTKFRKKYTKLFMDLGVLGMTIPDKPNSPNQKYFLTEAGKRFVEVLQQRL
jgi:ATP-dependent DNA helicase RecG